MTVKTTVFFGKMSFLRWGIYFFIFYVFFLFISYDFFFGGTNGSLRVMRNKVNLHFRYANSNWQFGKVDSFA